MAKFGKAYGKFDKSQLLQNAIFIIVRLEVAKNWYETF